MRSSWSKECTAVPTSEDTRAFQSSTLPLSCLLTRRTPGCMSKAVRRFFGRGTGQQLLQTDTVGTRRQAFFKSQTRNACVDHGSIAPAAAPATAARPVVSYVQPSSARDRGDGCSCDKPACGRLHTLAATMLASTKCKPAPALLIDPLERVAAPPAAVGGRRRERRRAPTPEAELKPRAGLR